MNRDFSFKHLNTFIIILILSLDYQKANAEKCPCDIYADGGTPCVAAHSTVRALYSSYNGSLYQVRRKSDNKTKDIGVLTTGGYVNSAVQDSFLNGTTGTISIIYDQSGKGNHLTSAPGGQAVSTPDKEVTANRSKIMINGHPAYAVYFEGGMGYRNNKTIGIATGDQPEGEYMVTNGKHYNEKCCFDYGNAETDNNDDCAGTMEAIYFGNSTEWGKGSGTGGPWVMADLEDGLFGGKDFSANPSNTPLTSDYVTATLKGKSHHWAIKGGNAQSGALKTMYDGVRPPQRNWDGCVYDPMRKQGAIILGIGGDNSNWSIGTFYEGAMTFGYPSDSIEDLVQENIVAAGYGNSTMIDKPIFNRVLGSSNSPTINVNCNKSTLRIESAASLDLVKSIKVFDLKGNLVKTLALQTQTGTINSYNFDLGSMHEGFYIVNIDNRNGEIQRSKIILAR